MAFMNFMGIVLENVPRRCTLKCVSWPLVTLPVSWVIMISNELVSSSLQLFPTHFGHLVPKLELLTVSWIHLLFIWLNYSPFSSHFIWLFSDDWWTDGKRFGSFPILETLFFNWWRCWRPHAQQSLQISPSKFDITHIRFSRSTYE